MPIKGWGDNAARAPRLGKIYLGVKQDNRPRAVDYFVVPDEVKAVYGEKPAELDIVFHSDDINEVMPSWLKRYGDQAGLICRGDGATASIKASYMVKNGEREYGVKYDSRGGFKGPDGRKLEIVKGEDKKPRVVIRCLYRNCPFYKKKKCREVATLNVMLYKIPGVLGVYSLDTNSINTYTNIKDGFMMLKKIYGRASLVKGIKLKVKMQEAHPEIEGGKNIKTIIPVCYITMGNQTLDDIMNTPESNITIKHLPPVLADQKMDIEPQNEEEKPELLYPSEENPGENISRTGSESPAGSEPPVKEAPHRPAAGPQTSPGTPGLPLENTTTIRLSDKIPVKPVTMSGGEVWFFTGERKTKSGLLKGKLLVPKQIAGKDLVGSLKVGDLLKVASKTKITSKQDFIITASSIEIVKPAARAG